MTLWIDFIMRCFLNAIFKSKSNQPSKVLFPFIPIHKLFKKILMLSELLVYVVNSTYMVII
jgi:hypothetical protein